MYKFSVCLFFFVVFLGCMAPSLEGYRKKGERCCDRFTIELSSIHTREELVEALPEIKKRYEELVDLLIEVHVFEQKNSEQMDVNWDTADLLHSEKLAEQLQRIYLLEGGKELMDSAQKEALYRLDAALGIAKK